MSSPFRVVSERESYIELDWPVASQGYFWDEDSQWLAYPMDFGSMRKIPGPVLLARDGEYPAAWPFKIACKYCKPMEVQALHRTFADLPLTQEGVLKFCSRFGLLGRMLVKRLLVVPSAMPIPFENATAVGETLEYSLYQMSKVRELLRLASLLRSPETNEKVFQSYWFSFPRVHPELAKQYDNRRLDTETIHVAGLNKVVALSTLYNELSRGVGIYPYNPPFELSRRFKSHGGRPFRALPSKAMVTRLLEHEINDELDAGTCSTLRIGSSTRMKLQPRDLLGAIYCHLALELSGQTAVPKRCPSCQSWFEPAHLRQKYCEERCKTKAYRLRKKTAVVS